jgi:hypothetical protein
MKVFETSGGIHCHMVFIGCRKIMEQLERSKHGPIIKVAPAPNPEKYLSKERTPQAGYRRNHLLGDRLNGSHLLPGGGDRVRLSKALEHDAIDAGYVEPWVHTNGRRVSVSASINYISVAAQEKAHDGNVNQLGNFNKSSPLSGRGRNQNFGGWRNQKFR